MNTDRIVIDGSWYVRPAGTVRERHSAGGIVARLDGGRVYIVLVRDNEIPDYVLPKAASTRAKRLKPRRGAKSRKNPV
jgi:hypothetical protein